jgi:DNA-binding transcriptional regulator YiaG
MEHDGRSYSFTVPNIELLKCSSCQEQVLPNNSLIRIYDKLRSEAGLLSPAEIRDNRNRLGLTQDALATHLNIAKETISRWETGGQIQQRGYDTLLRVYFALKSVPDYLAPKLPGPALYPVRLLMNSASNTNTGFIEISMIGDNQAIYRDVGAEVISGAGKQRVAIGPGGR